MPWAAADGSSRRAELSIVEPTTSVEHASVVDLLAALATLRAGRGGDSSPVTEADSGARGGSGDGSGSGAAVRGVRAGRLGQPREPSEVAAQPTAGGGEQSERLILTLTLTLALALAITLTLALILTLSLTLTRRAERTRRAGGGHASGRLALPPARTPAAPTRDRCRDGGGRARARDSSRDARAGCAHLATATARRRVGERGCRYCGG